MHTVGPVHYLETARRLSVQEWQPHVGFAVVALAYWQICTLSQLLLRKCSRTIQLPVVANHCFWSNPLFTPIFSLLFFPDQKIHMILLITQQPSQFITLYNALLMIGS
jgi:hypothetical protein